MDIDDHILRELSTLREDARAITINDLARAFGVSAGALRPAAQRLVGMGLAEGTMVQLNGVPTLHALRPATARSTRPA